MIKDPMTILSHLLQGIAYALTLVLSCTLTLDLSGQCYDVKVESQVHVNLFSSGYDSCSVVVGNLELGPYITSLKGLAGIKSISKDLIIHRTQLKDLAGLDSLKFIGGNLIISENDSLLDTWGLDGLSIIGGDTYIGKNPNLTKLGGLSQLNTIGGDLEIDSNASLSPSIDLPQLKIIGKSLFIKDNASLTSVFSNANLDQIGINIELINNAELHSLNGLENLKSISKLIIRENEKLESLQGLSLKSASHIEIHACPSLTKIQSLDSISRIFQNLIITNNASLENLNGLDRLNYVGQTLWICENPHIEDLQSLGKLKFIGKDLILRNNINLRSIALPQLDSIGRNLGIADHPNLTNCTEDWICRHINAQKHHLIFNNTESCNARSVMSQCRSAQLAQRTKIPQNLFPNPTEGLIFFPNPTGEEIQITVFNTFGQRIMTIPAQANKTLVFDASKLPSGNYYLKFSMNDKFLSTEPFTKI